MEKQHDPVALGEEVDRRTWFHSIDLGEGIVTPGVKDTLAEVRHMRIPADLTGKTVLDIGAYDGFYSFEAERRGASHVLATDDWAWTWPGSDARRNFELARQVLRSTVASKAISVEELGPDTVGRTFDVVLFLGVLYHAPDPIGYLERVRAVTGTLAIIETVVDLLDVPVPACGYYPSASLNHDASNHFGPNPAAVVGMLRDVGFSAVVAFPPWQTSKEWAVPASTTTSSSPILRRVRRRLRSARSGRAVFHAFV
jgi:tRNA (mo5U34)-methyltransferase